MKYRYTVIFCLVFFVFFSCSTGPKFGKSNNLTVEAVIKKRGAPKYDYTYQIDKDFQLNLMDPDYSLYFTEEELMHGVAIRRLAWENIFKNRLIVWSKYHDNQWVIFDSVEYNVNLVKF